MLWRKDVGVCLQSYSRNHIYALAKIGKESEWWHFTGIYGNPEVCRRKETWQLLRYLSKNSIRPWLCVGDFNEILHQHEKAGLTSRAQWQITDFRRCLDEVGLQDMGFRGNLFTWCNGKEYPHTIRAWLDRACCNPNWSQFFPKAHVQHEELSSSDHSAIWMDLDPPRVAGFGQRKKRFRFEAVWPNT
ncbi:UNVERIFIED_CONTAM: hypothetical protein Slati_2774300 [Sesamum latifolium]|uniref:Exo_endo_phos domain-containing protein n=1 Tax=Sesamum latifolium TaxID=2727402 RepID=A0AAW2W2Q3_9LAMI